MQSDPHERRDAAIHAEIARRLREDPGLVARARERLEAVIEAEAVVDPVLVEWRDALLMLDAEQLARFLESSTPRAVRMRISSPLIWLAR